MVDTSGRFVWYELMTTDVDAARVFYTDVVGWSARDVSVPGMPYTLFLAGENPVGGLQRLADEATRSGTLPRWLGYVQVGDVDAAAGRVRALGGTVYIPPTTIAGVSRFSVVADTQNAVFALIRWEHPWTESASALRATGRVGWHELFADDCDSALRFYGDLFGWRKTITKSGELGSYQMFASHGQTAGGVLTKPPALPAPFWLHYFNVGDIDAAVSRVTAGGGQIINGPRQAPDGSWIVQCTDPQDAIFALIGKRSYAAVGFLERISGQE
jgi:uncharacterized protein